MENSMFEKRTSEYRRILQEVAKEHDIDANLLRQLIDYEQERVHLQRRRGAKSDIQEIIEQTTFGTE